MNNKRELPALPADLEAMLDFWIQSQVSMRRIVRWSRFQNRWFRTFEWILQLVERARVRIEKLAGMRRQTVMSHSYGISVLALHICVLLKPYFNFDMSLVVAATLLHDQAEGALGRDVQYVRKGNSHDLEEAVAFDYLLKKLPDAVSKQHLRAFLLQFCLKSEADRAVFSSYAQFVMEDLARTCKYEAMAFDAIEHWDYFMYILEQARDYGNWAMLYDVLHNTRPVFNRLCEELPGFRQELYTPEVEAWCQKFIKLYEDCYLGFQPFLMP